MTNLAEKTPTQESTQERLPEFRPSPSAPQPIRPVWIPWPLAVLLVPLFWIMPKKMGPHFASVRWPGAIIAHLFWTVYAIGCMGVAYWTPRFGLIAYILGQTPGQAPDSAWPPTMVSEILLAPLAMLGTLLAGNPLVGISGGVTNPSDVFLGLAMILGTEASLMTLACLLMPYAAAGERDRLLFARCVKLTFWASTSLPLLGLAFQAIELLNYTRPQLDELWATAIGIYILWFAFFWVRSGLRYAGPAEGPGWEPRRPLCETCGYVLTGLRPVDNCPECGTGVAVSLPDRRRPTKLAVARRLFVRPLAFVRTWRDALSRDFHERLELDKEYAPARRFAIVMCILGGLLPQPAIAADTILNVSRGRGPEAWAELVESCIGIGLALLLALSVLVLASRTSGNGSIRRAAPVVFYWSAWFVPLIAALYLSFAIIYVIKRVLRIHREIAWFPENWPDWGELLCAGAVMLIPIAFLIAAIRLARALRQTRFANG